MIFTMTGQVFAGTIDDINHNTFTLENGQEITEQELIKLLEGYDGDIFKVSDNTTHIENNLKGNNVKSYPSDSIVTVSWQFLYGWWENGLFRL